MFKNTEKNFHPSLHFQLLIANLKNNNIIFFLFFAYYFFLVYNIFFQHKEKKFTENELSTNI